MNYAEKHASAIALGVDRAIGYAESGPRIISIPTTDSDYEGRIIAPVMLGWSSDSESLINGRGYAVQHFGKPPLKIEDLSRPFRPPLIEINATESYRIATWPGAMTGQVSAEGRRLGIAQRMLSDTRDSLYNSLNKLTLRLLTAASEQENRLLEWNDDQRSILDRLETGWRLMFPKGTEFLPLRLELRKREFHCTWSPYLDGTVGYLVDPKTAGVWRNAGEVRIVPWANGRDLTFGISSYWLCGQAVRDSQRVIAVHFGQHPVLDEGHSGRAYLFKGLEPVAAPMLR